MTQRAINESLVEWSNFNGLEQSRSGRRRASRFPNLTDSQEVVICLGLVRTYNGSGVILTHSTNKAVYSSAVASNGHCPGNICLIPGECEARLTLYKHPGHHPLAIHLQTCPEPSGWT